MAKIIKISILLAMCALFFSSCEKQPGTKKQDAPPVVVTGSIPAIQIIKSAKSLAAKPLAEGNGKNVSSQKFQTKAGGKKAQAIAGQVTEGSAKEEQAVVDPIAGISHVIEKNASYDPRGRVDPFLSLIQEKEEPAITIPDIEEKPKRMLTPLEKLELSQIRLVAVILMKNRQLAMVEEATGKGYEIKVGTYIGKNGGQVSKINQSSIVITEHVKDYKGKRQERFQEIKLHKKENGE